MITFTKRTYYIAGAAFTAGMISGPSAAFAGTQGFGVVAKNITTGISEIPALLTSLSYLAGTLLAVFGIMKIKDHVENPTQTPLKDGAVRLISGAALLALPVIVQAMLETGGTTTQTAPIGLKKAAFSVVE